MSSVFDSEVRDSSGTEVKRRRRTPVVVGEYFGSGSAPFSIFTDPSVFTSDGEGRLEAATAREGWKQRSSAPSRRSTISLVSFSLSRDGFEGSRWV